ncbi:MAG: alpha/beta hydrolase [Dehalococcoidia bacterium]
MTALSYLDQQVTVSGISLHYQEWGDPAAPPIIMLHGFGVSGHMFDEFAGRLADRYHLIALDQRGHGDSAWSDEGDYSREAFVRDLEGFREALGIERFILIGHSMGGLNSVSYTASYPSRVSALVLVDVGPEAAREGVDNIMRFTRGPDELDFEEFVQMAHQFNQRRTIENIRERMRHRLRQMENGKWTWKFDKRFRQPDSGLRIGNELSNDETWKMFRELRPPVLLVRGGESDVLKPDVADRCVREMQRARLVTVPGAGHSVPGDNPDDFTEAVSLFLDDVAAGKFEPYVEATPPPLTALVTEQDRASCRRPGVLTGVLVAGGAIAALATILLVKGASSEKKQRRRSQNPAAQVVDSLDAVAASAMGRARDAVAAVPAAVPHRRKSTTRRGARLAWRIVSFAPRRMLAGPKK